MFLAAVITTHDNSLPSLKDKGQLMLTQLPLTPITCTETCGMTGAFNNQVYPPGYMPFCVHHIMVFIAVLALTALLFFFPKRFTKLNISFTYDHSVF